MPAQMTGSSIHSGSTVTLPGADSTKRKRPLLRLHRVVATTRKNALFAGSDSGARSWAIFTSLIQSAKMNGLNPFEYLKDVLERVVSGDVKAHQLDRLLPWKAERTGRTNAQAA
jgi:transposase